MPLFLSTYVKSRWCQKKAKDGLTLNDAGVIKGKKKRKALIKTEKILKKNLMINHKREDEEKNPKCVL
jgi:hypothetical protein